MTVRATFRQADAIDTALFILFLIGIYVGYSPKLAAGIPLPSALAGVAGFLMLLRNSDLIRQRHAMALLGVISLYLFSIFLVPDTAFLGERFKGFLQLSYSLIIGYAAYLTCTLYDRDRLARIFLFFCLAILIGCALETLFTSVREFSDTMRGMLFDQHIYAAAKRDLELYGSLRPNLFTSEPSYVAFSFTLFAFVWYVLTTAGGKTLTYVIMLAAGLLLMRSPTVVLGFVLIAPYQFLLAGRSAHGRTRSFDSTVIVVTVLTLFAVSAMLIAGERLFAERLSQIANNNDASFFFRVVGPVAVAWETMMQYPIAGAGLTGEELIANSVYQIYVTAPGFSPNWEVDKIAEVVTNYFWHHWIYLGLIGGIVLLYAIGRLLRSLSAPSISFCLLVWAIMGQASGAYVSPKPWSVLLLSCAIACLHFRQPHRLPARVRERSFVPQHTGNQLR